MDKRPFLSLLSDADRAKVNTNIFHSSSADEQKLSISLKNISGELTPCEILSFPILDFQDSIESFILVIKIEKVEKNVEIHETKPRVANSKLDPSFLSNLFHELLTPMNVIVGFAQEITDSLSNPSEDQKEAAEIIQENQKILLQTMDTAVEYTHMEQNDFSLTLQEVVFVDILDKIEASIKKVSKNAGVKLQYGKVSSSLQFITDESRFNTLLNLILKFSLQMTKEKIVFLSAYSIDDDSFALTIKDRRGSISDLLLQKITLYLLVNQNHCSFLLVQLP